MAFINTRHLQCSVGPSDSWFVQTSQNTWLGNRKCRKKTLYFLNNFWHTWLSGGFNSSKVDIYQQQSHAMLRVDIWLPDLTNELIIQIIFCVGIFVIGARSFFLVFLRFLAIGASDRLGSKRIWKLLINYTRFTPSLCTLTLYWMSY